MNDRGRKSAADSMSRRQAMKLGGATIAAAMMTPIEAVARGLAIEGVRATYVRQVQMAIAGMRSLNAIRAELLACQDRVMQLNPCSEEWRAADDLQSHLLFEQRQAMFKYGGIITGAAFGTQRGPIEAAMQRDARVLWEDLYGKEVQPRRRDCAAWEERRFCVLEKARAERIAAKRAVQSQA